MTNAQKEEAYNQLILLDKKDVMELTGWCENVTNRVFANDEAFPAIKKGKKYQVELSALKEYLSKRRVNSE